MIREGIGDVADMKQIVLLVVVVLSVMVPAVAAHGPAVVEGYTGPTQLDTQAREPATLSFSSTDGDFAGTWTQMTAGAEWSERNRHTSVVLSDGSIVLMGGNDANTHYNDVWRSTDQGATWTQMTANAGWAPRASHTSVALSDDSIVLMAGYDNSTKKTRYNDVWRSTDKGATWTRMTANAGWSGRELPASVALSDDSIILMGGDDGGSFLTSSRKNDVWRSTDKGATWKRLTANAGWKERYSNNNVVVLSDDTIILMGGVGPDWHNDVWKSIDQGAKWTRVTADAGWAKRATHDAVALSDDSIILMGGNDANIPYNDIWQSTDRGATWSRITANAAWSPRTTFTSVIFPDDSIVLMGGYSGGPSSDGHRLNDVWRMDPPGPLVADFSADPTSGPTPLTVEFTDTSTGLPTSWLWDFGDGETSTDRNPVHIYRDPGEYDVNLTVKRGSASNTVIKAAYITILPSPTRVISPASSTVGSDIDVTVNLFPGDTRKTVTLKETIPSGWAVTPLSPTTADTTVSGSRVEWTWSGITPDDSVTYRISIPPSAPAGIYRIVGTVTIEDRTILTSGDHEVAVTALPGEEIAITSIRKTYRGHYFTDIPLENTFTLTTEGDIDYIEFDVSGVVVTDTDGTDGWGCTLDMGSMEPGTLITITAYSPEGIPSQPVIYAPSIIRSQDWFTKIVISDNVQVRAISPGKDELIFEIEKSVLIPKEPIHCSVKVPKEVPMGGEYGLDIRGELGGKVASDGTADIFGGANTEITIADRTGKINGRLVGTLVIGPDENGNMTLKLDNVCINLKGGIEIPIPGLSYDIGVGKVYATVGTELDGNLYIFEDPDGGVAGGLGLSRGDAELNAKIKGAVRVGEDKMYVELAAIGGVAVVMTAPPPELEDYYIELIVEKQAVIGPVTSSQELSWCYHPKRGSDSMILSIPPNRPEDWHPVERDYIVSGYGRFNSAGVRIHSIDGASDSELTWDILLDRCYPYASPDLIALPDNRHLLLWVHDIPEKPHVQGLEIMYSVNDGSGWSTPRGVTDNLVADYDPMVVVDQNGAVIALWSTVADPSVTAETPALDIMNATELAWAYYAPEEGTWSEPALLTNNSWYDGKASLSAGADGSVGVVWVRDRDGDVFTIHDQDIYYAAWNGVSWTEPELVAENIPITSGPVLTPPGTIAWAADTDGDPETSTDREIFIAPHTESGWGRPEQITTNTREGTRPVFLADSGEWLAWVEKEASLDRICVVQTATAGQSTPEIAAIRPSVNELHLMAAENGNLLAIWQGISDNGQDIFVSVRDAASGRWSGGSQVTNDVAEEWQLSPSLDANGHLVVAYISSSDTDENDSSALSVLVRPIRMDCSVDEDGITYEDGVISAVIHNIGDLQAENVEVIFTDGVGGSVIGGVQMIELLPAGDNKTISVEWLPPDKDSHEIVVTVDPYDRLVEIDRMNNEVVATFFLPDLVVSDLRVGRSNPSLIEWNVENIGEGTAYDIMINISDLNSSVIDEKMIAEIQPGTKVSCNTTWDQTTAEAGVHAICVTIDPDKAIFDANAENNQVLQWVALTPDLILNSTGLDVTDPGSGPVILNVTVWNDGDYIAENVTVTVTSDGQYGNTTICGTAEIPSIFPEESAIASLDINLSAGFHTLMVTVENGGHEIDRTNNVALTSVLVARAPTANFTSTITSIGKVQFTDLSSDSPTIWLWDFGDATNSDQQNPVHAYATDGNYTVTLIVCNEFGTDKLIWDDVITITGIGGPVNASFDADVTGGQAPLTVQFTDTSLGGPKEWRWTFGDGEESIDQHPVHVYQAGGNYSVSLHICNGTYEDICTLENCISVRPALTAEFNANVTSGFLPLAIGFQDMSVGDPDTWSWSFGDGNVSTEQNPIHTYTAPGNYTVNLTATNAGGSSTETRPDYITVTRVKGDFNGNGEVDIGDVSKVAYMVVGKEPADPTADFNGSDRIDIGDAAKIAYYFVGKIGEL